jgi:hypothetical protein
MGLSLHRDRSRDFQPRDLPINPFLSRQNPPDCRTVNVSHGGRLFKSQRNQSWGVGILPAPRPASRLRSQEFISNVNRYELVWFMRHQTKSGIMRDMLRVHKAYAKMKRYVWTQHLNDP